MAYINEFKMMKWQRLKNILETLYMEEYFGDRAWTEMINCLEVIKPVIEVEEEEEEEYCSDVTVCNCPECKKERSINA